MALPRSSAGALFLELHVTPTYPQGYVGKDSLTLKKKYARTNVLKYSFFHKITYQWNQLPLDIRASDNVNIFKSRVRKFFSDF